MLLLAYRVHAVHLTVYNAGAWARHSARENACAHLESLCRYCERFTRWQDCKKMHHAESVVQVPQRI
jgi:hypothetical protein